jgi:hypothetical protein
LNDVEKTYQDAHWVISFRIGLILYRKLACAVNVRSGRREREIFTPGPHNGFTRWRPVCYTAQK